MEADAVAKSLAEIRRQHAVQRIHMSRDCIDSPQCLPPSRRRISLQTKQRHHPVTEELVHRSARLPHSIADGTEEAVDDEHGVVGQALLSKPRRPAQIDEHRNNEALLSRLRSLHPTRLPGKRMGRKQRNHGEIALGSKLTGEPYTRNGADAIKSRLFGLARTRHASPVLSVHPPDPASRASSATAADAGMRNIVTP